jgi:uncharacterized Fe-S cluster-containing radical SAM superfamily protein
MDHTEKILKSGWHESEKKDKLFFRWIKKKAVLWINNIPPDPFKKLIIVASHPYPKEPDPKLKVIINNEQTDEKSVTTGSNSYQFSLKKEWKNLQIELHVNQTFPFSNTNDERELGIFIEEIKIYTSRTFSLPNSIEIESTTHCNINPPCVMCYPRIFEKRKYYGNIPKKIVDMLKPYLGEFKNLSFHGVGEPLLYKDIFVLLDYAKGENNFTHFNSNGLLLTKEVSKKLIEKKLKLIDISIDAACSETYKKIRGSDFDLLINNIKTLSELKKKMKSSYPEIMVNMTLMNENLDEAVAFIKLAKTLKAKIVHFGLLNPFDEYEIIRGNFIFNYKKQMIDIKTDYFNKIISRCKKTARDLNIVLQLEFSQYYY